MLMALAVLAAMEAASSSVVEVALTGGSGTPVSAAPRTLSDVARERREGRTAVGGFSAVETTIPGHMPNRVLPVEADEPEAAREPEIVEEPEPAWFDSYVPVWYGGPATPGRLRPRPVLHQAFAGNRSRSAPGRPASLARGRHGASPALPSGFGWSGRLLR